jgi:RimJ/RimL family protein N-acetyltransferase
MGRETGGEVITSLEMTSPNQLVPSRSQPVGIDVQEVGPDAASLVRSTYIRIWTPLASGGRMAWSETQWREELCLPGVRTWIAHVDGEVAGLVELEAAADGSGDVGIVVFGLAAEFGGRGLGGEFLTVATRLAWNMRTPSGAPARRVWLQTSSNDHLHARPNYESRGFRVFRTEQRSAESSQQMGSTI